jgi:exoribonuclease R
MLLANKKVAEFIGKQKKTFIYRIHDEPNEDKLLQCKLLLPSLDIK